MKTLINLIGEQPIPNLLPMLFLKPDRNIILYTQKTINVANRISKLSNNCTKQIIDPYNLNSISTKLEKLINNNDTLIFNITGGTKLMSIALFQFAISKNSEVVYLQSEKNKNTLIRFQIDNNDQLSSTSQKLPEIIDVKTYLKAHLHKYEIENNIDQNLFGIQYENAVVEVLRDNNFEVLQSVKPGGEGDQLEIDIVIRLKATNNVAIAEVKIGDYKMESPKKGIDQLSTAGSREYLGTYTKRFLITRRKLNERLNLLARKHNIFIIDRVHANNQNMISETAKIKLIETLTKHLS